MSQGDDVIVAWHEVPGRAPPKTVRPVGYGVISCRWTQIDRERLCPYMSGIVKATRSYRTLRDGSFEDALPGTSCQATIGVSLRDRLADDSRRRLAKLGHAR